MTEQEAKRNTVFPDLILLAKEQFDSGDTKTAMKTLKRWQRHGDRDQRANIVTSILEVDRLTVGRFRKYSEIRLFAE